MMFASRTITRAAVTAAIVLLLTTTAAINAAAQTSVFATLGGTLDGFRAVASPSDTRNNVVANAVIEREFNEQHGRVFYDFDAGTYGSPGDWSHYLHTAGFTYRFGADDATGRNLYLNGSLAMRRNGDDWASADYSAAGIGLNAEFHPGEASTVRSGYRLDYRNFVDYSPLTQLEHRVFGSMLANLQSRTTIVVEAQAGLKGYSGWVSTDFAALEAAAPVQTAGRGRGMGPGIRLGVSPTVSQVAESDDWAGLVGGLFRIAQSLSDRTGIHAQASVRHILGRVPPALVTTPAGFFEDGVYDDPYASRGVFAQIGLRREFRGGGDIEILGWWADKNYVSALALDDEGAEQAGGPLRADRLWLASATWTQPLLADRTGQVVLTLELTYRFTRHESNDAFYNYTSHAAGAGFTIGY
ncbi:MAG: hypothetical protein AB1806_11250 [Acidobacteriota bacterium]